MKRKNLEKKIRKLKARLEKDTKKLAKLTVRLSTTVAAGGAKKAPAKGAKKTAAPARKKAPKAKRKLNLSPERRAQLAAAMKARWEAKRSQAAQSQGQSPSGGESSTASDGVYPS